MSKQQPKTEPDPRDARIVELESQLARQSAELVMLTGRASDHPRNERRRAEHAKELAQQAIRDASPEERVRMFPDHYAIGGGRAFLQTLASFCDGGVVGFARICPPDVLEMVLASTPHPDLLRQEMAEADELPRFVRYQGRALHDWIAGGEEGPRPRVVVATCAEAPIQVTEAHAQALRDAGIATPRIGHDDARHYQGLNLHERDHLDETREAFEARLLVDAELREMIRSGSIVVRDLTEAEVRAHLAVARDWSVSHG